MLHAVNPDDSSGRHASPFGSVVTGSRETNLPDFPRDYPQPCGWEGFPDMSRFALLFTEQEASFLTRQGISLEALLDTPTMRARADDMPCWLHTHVTPACRHADGTISSSSVLDAWRMASEDPDEVMPGFAAIHRLSDLRDLYETASAQMTAVSD